MGYEDLFKTIKQGNLDQFKRLISSVYDENFLMTDENGNTLVHLAAIYDQPEMLRMLLEKGEEYNCSAFGDSNDNGFTPLECCYLYSSAKSLPLLQSNSLLSDSFKLVVSQDYQTIKRLRPSDFRGQELSKITMLASALGDVTALQILLDSTGDKENLLRHQTKDGWSGAHFAAYNDRLDALQLFPDEFVAKIKDSQGNTPLMVAAGRGNLKIIEYLLEQGCDLHQKNNHGENAVFRAAENGQLDTLKFLDKKDVDLTVVNDEGENALILAARNGHLACVSHLLDRGVPADLQDNQGKTAFRLALEISQLEIADLLVTQSTPNEKDQALFDAISRGDLVTVRWLVEHGASLSATDESKLTPMLFAASLGDIELIDYFLSLNPPPLHDKDSEGDSVLFVAIKNNQSSIVEHLVESGLFSLEERNPKGKPPLLVAAEVNSDTIVEFLHKNGASLEDQDEEGNTAFHLLLAKGNHGESMSYLYTHSPDLILKKNNRMESPLYTAIMHNRTDQIKDIINLIDLNPATKSKLFEAKDKDSNTALLSAVACHNFEAIPLLLAAGADVLAKNNKDQSVISITYLSQFPRKILKPFFDAYQIDYREYLSRRRLYFIFGGEKLNEALKFSNAEVRFGGGLFDEGVGVLKNYLKTFIQKKHPEYSSQFEPLFRVLDRVHEDSTVENILHRLESDGEAFQATGFTNHVILATLKNLSDGSMKLSLSERGARVGGAPFLNDENKKFSAVRSIIVPPEKREKVIELLHQAKNEPQAKGVDILFNQIPEFVGEPYQFSTIYQKKFMDICFYSNPKTGLYQQFIEILGDESGKAFYKEFELYMREQELDKYKEFCRQTHPENNVQENPIVVKAEELIENRHVAINASVKPT